MKIKKYGIYNCSDLSLGINRHRNKNHDVVVVKKGLIHSKVKPLTSLTYTDENGLLQIKYENFKRAINGEINPLCRPATGCHDYSGVYQNIKKVKNKDLKERIHHDNVKVLRKYRKHLS